MSQEQAGVNGLSRHKRQCAHWHLFHGSIDTSFPCEKDNQRKQQRSSCLRRPQSMGREEVREATNYIAEWVETVESKVDSVRR